MISVVDEVDDGVVSLAFGTGDSVGKGGMEGKLRAAKMAMRCGIETVVANGRRPDILRDVLGGKPIGTRFRAHPVGLVGWKRWLAFGTEVKGRVTVNEGAWDRIVRDGKSLLPVGVVGIDGKFEAGETVVLLNPAGAEFARGISSYAADELQRVMGLRTDQISAVAGLEPSEVVHRDNMVMEA